MLRERRLGLACGVVAYLIWGFFPIYLKAVVATPVLEVLSHRVVWAFLFLLAAGVCAGACLRRSNCLGRSIASGVQPSRSAWWGFSATAAELLPPA